MEISPQHLMAAFFPKSLDWPPLSKLLDTSKKHISSGFSVFAYMALAALSHPKLWFRSTPPHLVMPPCNGPYHTPNSIVASFNKRDNSNHRSPGPKFIRNMPPLQRPPRQGKKRSILRPDVSAIWWTCREVWVFVAVLGIAFNKIGAENQVKWKWNPFNS